MTTIAVLYLLTKPVTDTYFGVGENVVVAFGVAFITFLFPPTILFFLTWIKESAKSAQKRKKEWEEHVARIVHDKLDKKLKPIAEDIHEVKEDIRRLEDILLGTRSRNNDDPPRH